ncbi:MAG: PA2778 family cysteine peptidase [Gammaproteobacteria bacterium]|nr:PA2778 family cysteine peptidase [Gammaproteobacteria bacterium]
MSGRPGAVLLAAAVALSACASRPPLLPEWVAAGAAPVELSDTPFFAQDAYQCGPAALATVLHRTGVDASPDALAEQVYLPGQKGSLQVELLAATRRSGRIPYAIDPRPQSLFAELAAGRPVLVLQNLGFTWMPAWHYAVVIGFDLSSDSFILRSGTERRLLSPARSFLRTWRLAGHWAMVVLRPGELPAGPDRERYLHAAALTEPYLTPAARGAAYQAALQVWPDDATAHFGSAFALHAAGDLADAEHAYRELLDRQPRHVAALNNLAEVLAARGCYGAARKLARRALQIAGVDAPGLLDAINATLRDIPQQPDRAACADDRDGVPAR